VVKNSAYCFSKQGYPLLLHNNVLFIFLYTLSLTTFQMKVLLMKLDEYITFTTG